MRTGLFVLRRECPAERWFDAKGLEQLPGDDLPAQMNRLAASAQYHVGATVAGHLRERAAYTAEIEEVWIGEIVEHGPAAVDGSD